MSVKIPEPRNDFERDLFSLLRIHGGEYDYDDVYKIVRNGDGELVFKRKREPRGLPCSIPNSTGRRLRGEFITTFTIPGKRSPKKRMLLAAVLDDEIIELYVLTMGCHHAKDVARRWRN